MGKFPLGQLAKEKDLEIQWKAFELRPEGVVIPKKDPEMMARGHVNVDRMAEGYGVTFNWHEKSEHSRKALEGAKFAEEQGKSQEYHGIVFKAQFQDGKNINDIDTLTDLVAEIGLDPAGFKKAVESGRYEDDVLRDHAEAQSLGITGIPCFVVGNQGVMGAQSYDTLKSLIEEA